MRAYEYTGPKSFTLVNFDLSDIAVHVYPVCDSWNENEESLQDRIERRDIQMVRLFVVIAVCRLGAGPSQAPDGVARGHQARETVTSHARERYARIPPRSTSPRASPNTRAQEWINKWREHPTRHLISKSLLNHNRISQKRWQTQLSGRWLTWR